MEAEKKGEEHSRCSTKKKPCRRISDLPDALLIDIFRRLPSLTIVNTSWHVCKAWRKVLSNPSASTIINSRYCLLVNLERHPIELESCCPKNFCLLDLESPDDEIRRHHPDGPIILNPNFDLFPFGDLEVRNSCNGLLCLSSRDSCCAPIIILNPLTREYISIPPSYSHIILATFLGYGPSTKQYKVVRFVFDCVSNIRRTEVYTLGSTGKWRFFTDAPEIKKREFTSSSCVILNGSIYWKDDESTWAIKAFNFEVKKSQIVSDLPKDGLTLVNFLSQIFTRVSVGALHGCLCASISEHFPSLNASFDIWVLNNHEYGKPGSWTKKLTIERGYSGLRKLSFKGNGQLLVVGGTNYLVAYNIENKSYEVVEIPSIETREVFPYTPSSISL